MKTREECKHIRFINSKELCGRVFAFCTDCNHEVELLSEIADEIRTWNKRSPNYKNDPYYQAIHENRLNKLSSPEKKEEIKSKWKKLKSDIHEAQEFAMTHAMDKVETASLLYGDDIKKEEPTQELKKSISEIFIKWGLPTRQVAINEIVNLVERLLK